MSLSLDATHVQVYSGSFDPGSPYKKFDIVSHPKVPGLFYYAKQDVVLGGGAYLSAANRFVFDKDANTIFDSQGGGDFIIEGFKAEQIIKVEDSVNNNFTFTLASVTQDTLTILDRPSHPNIREEDGDGSNTVKISAIDQVPGESSNELWSQNDFFFDPDYGATVSFSTDSAQLQYGDGYFSLYPKGINSLNARFDLTFSNRTTREASSIMHFLENKVGQHEVDAPVDYLPYKQGISGFSWGGDSMFFPYNSTENLSKRFFSRNFSHDLNSENSNTVQCSFENFDTSILRKSEQIWTERVDSWDDEAYYNLNDVSFLPENHQFYYCSGAIDAPTNSHPTGINGIPTENNPWSRAFSWKPSLGLSIKEEPRLKESTLGFSSYKQVYNDGINESLLNFDLSFKNRDDEETKAILHFLETHYGAKSFSYKLPAPYDTTKRFICPEWKHTYVFKNTHDIDCTFVEFPFDFTDEEFDNIVTDTELRGAELSAPKIVSMGLMGDGQKRRCRIEVQTLGDNKITNLTLGVPQSHTKQTELYSFDGVSAKFVEPSWSSTGLTKKDRAVINDSTFGRVRISPNMSNGPEGGIYFYKLSDEGDVLFKFFQNNQGNIRSIDEDFSDPLLEDLKLTASLSQPLEYINSQMINANEATELNPGETCYFEVVFDPAEGSDPFQEDQVQASSFLVSGLWVDSKNVGHSASTRVLVLAFRGSRWRPHQLNQDSSHPSTDGTIKLSKLTVRSESENTDPYVYYDGCFDGRINIKIDHTSLKILGDFPATYDDDGNLVTPAKVWEADETSVVQWAVSITGGRSWRMKSLPVTRTAGGSWSFDELNIFKEKWGNAEAGRVDIAICDLVGEDILSASVTIPFAKAAVYVTSGGSSNFLFSFISFSDNSRTRKVSDAEPVVTKNLTKAFNKGLRTKFYQGT